MLKSCLRLLAIGTDAVLAGPPSQATGDAHQRQLKYASVLSDYQMVVRTLGRPKGRSANSPGFTVYASGSANRALFPLDAYRLGLELHRRHGFHLVSTEDPMLCGLVGALLRRRFGLPLSVQLAGDMLDNPYWLADRGINPLLNALGKSIVRCADSVRVVSASERDKIIGFGVAPERVWNLGWILDPEPYQAADGTRRRRELLGGGFERLVLFVGRLVLQKDLPTLLRGAAAVRKRFPSARFVLAGGGPESTTVARLSEELGLGDGVLQLGPVPHAELPEYYAAADIFVLPSRYEGNARVLAEAAAAGLPCVTTNVSGARDTVRDGETGLVVAVGQSEVFAERVLQLLSDPEGAAEMGRLGRDHVTDRYGPARLLPAFRSFWEATALRNRAI